MATAGHVDHGKTSLIKHLTGVDTDRLEEEKRRGLSINLGFAYRKLAGHSPIGFVDVPGHNRFINTMIAGVSGIDLGMLVVAADDGPMPQTIEHLDVLKLLGVENYLLVISKTDRADDSRVQQVQQQVLQMLAGVTNAEVPVYPVSNTSGEGIAALLAYLEDRARSSAPRAASGRFRLSIDRAFNLKGAGLVVTGTATAGTIGVGDYLKLQPRDVKLRVRSIHVQDEEATAAAAGQRCALNVVGDIEKDAIERGDWLVDLEAGPVSRRIDARVKLLANAPFPLKHLSPLKIHLAAKRVAGKIFLLDETSGGKRLEPGAEVLAQLLLEADVSCCHGERFLLRDDSESVTLGGGVVLDPYAPRTGKARPERLHCLQALDTGSPGSALQALLLEQDLLLDLVEFKHSWNLRDDEVQGLWGSEVHSFEADGHELLISESRWQQGRRLIIETLSNWHQQNPREPGIKPPRLKSELARAVAAPLWVALLGELLRDAQLTLKDGKLQLAGHKASVSAEAVARWEKFEAFLQQRGKDIPLLSEVSAATGLDKNALENVARVAVKEGRLHKLTDNRYASPVLLGKLAQLVNELVAANEPITVINFKGRMDTGRKVAIEVLEYFDSVRFTQRREDVRVVLDTELPARLFNG
ncbi:MAG: selenocysteine-specific translation elongation factor [Gammaproteobacteria bacterium]|nr:selenocysteine-specific translation elongation factor [Gammaproteobacteria bacterium]